MRGDALGYRGCVYVLRTGFASLSNQDAVLAGQGSKSSLANPPAVCVHSVEKALE